MIISESYFGVAILVMQWRRQDLDQPLQNIVQNFDDDVTIMTLTSLLWHRRKAWKILNIEQSR